MSFRIDIRGLDKLKRELESLEQGLTVETIDFWCRRILNDVRLKTDDELANSLVLESRKTSNGEVEILFSSPQELINSIIETSKLYLPEMVITTRVFFEKFIEIIKEQAEVEAND